MNLERFFHEDSEDSVLTNLKAEKIDSIFFDFAPSFELLEQIFQQRWKRVLLFLLENRLIRFEDLLAPDLFIPWDWWLEFFERFSRRDSIRGNRKVLLAIETSLCFNMDFEPIQDCCVFLEQNASLIKDPLLFTGEFRRKIQQNPKLIPVAVRIFAALEKKKKHAKEFPFSEAFQRAFFEYMGGFQAEFAWIFNEETPAEILPPFSEWKNQLKGYLNPAFVFSRPSDSEFFLLQRVNTRQINRGLCLVPRLKPRMIHPDHLKNFQLLSILTTNSVMSFVSDLPLETLLTEPLYSILMNQFSGLHVKRRLAPKILTMILSLEKNDKNLLSEFLSQNSVSEFLSQNPNSDGHVFRELDLPSRRILCSRVLGLSQNLRLNTLKHAHVPWWEWDLKEYSGSDSFSPHPIHAILEILHLDESDSRGSLENFDDKITGLFRENQKGKFSFFHTPQMRVLFFAHVQRWNPYRRIRNREILNEICSEEHLPFWPTNCFELPETAWFVYQNSSSFSLSHWLNAMSLLADSYSYNPPLVRKMCLDNTEHQNFCFTLGNLLLDSQKEEAYSFLMKSGIQGQKLVWRHLTEKMGFSMNLPYPENLDVPVPVLESILSSLCENSKR